MRFLSLRKRRGCLRFLAVLLGAGIIVWLILRLYNNVSLASDTQFENSLQTALQNAEHWVNENQQTILKEKNIALLKMLQECNQMHESPVITAIVSSFLKEPARPRCWRVLLEPDWPVDEEELNKTFQHEYIDNQWILYALAPNKVRTTPEYLGLFELNRWKRRQLTHQLWALIHLRERNPDTGDHDPLIQHLCERITDDLWNDMAVVDIYIQKTAFVLRSGHPAMIRRRWIERIIRNQNQDGGWDDRWMYFFRSSRKPVWRRLQGSDSHATIQALWLLYQIRYKYADSFVLNVLPEKQEDQTRV